MRNYMRTQNLETIEAADLEIFITGEHTAMGFAGRSRKSFFNYRFNSRERMMEYINTIIEKRTETLKIKEEMKKEQAAKKAEMIKNIKVGDIFYRSWGYEQTNVDFYQVVRKTKSSVVVREVAQNRTETGWAQGRCSAVKDSFLQSSKEELKRINAYGCTGLSKWDGQELHWSAYH